MDDSIYENYKVAGKIAAETRDYGCSLIKPGVTLLDVANKVESKIYEMGGEPAFPVNISIDKAAAHFSPKHDTKLTFKKGDVVKLDVGAHVNGYIADTAITVEIDSNKYKKMIKASEDALIKAIEILKPGIDLSDLGNIIEQTIKSYGYNPISNLSGHGLERYVLHSGLSVPNVSGSSVREKPKIGDVIAIEPFATNGEGRVISGNGSNIYLCKESFRSRIIRDNKSKVIFNKIFSNFKTLPFAERWCINFIPNGIEFVLKKLTFLGLVKQYPQLLEAKDGIVTQSEHTVILNDDGCEVIT
jgi:methionyl aminopeptidase